MYRTIFPLCSRNFIGFCWPWLKYQLLSWHKIICIIARFAFNWILASHRRKRLPKTHKTNRKLLSRCQIIEDIFSLLSSLYLRSDRKSKRKKAHKIFFVTRELRFCINKNIIFYGNPFSLRCHNNNESFLLHLRISSFCSSEKDVSFMKLEEFWKFKLFLW